MTQPDLWWWGTEEQTNPDIIYNQIVVNHRQLRMYQCMKHNIFCERWENSLSLGNPDFKTEKYEHYQVNKTNGT
jgi:hypothetical protein